MPSTTQASSGAKGAPDRVARRASSVPTGAADFRRKRAPNASTAEVFGRPSLKLQCSPHELQIDGETWGLVPLLHGRSGDRYQLARLGDGQLHIMAVYGTRRRYAIACDCPEFARQCAAHGHEDASCAHSRALHASGLVRPRPSGESHVAIFAIDPAAQSAEEGAA